MLATLTDSPWSKCLLVANLGSVEIISWKIKPNSSRLSKKKCLRLGGDSRKIKIEHLELTYERMGQLEIVK